MTICERCGEVNPAEIHTCTPQEPEYRDVVIKGDLWRIEFLPDHAASVVLVRANYEDKLKQKNA